MSRTVAYGFGQIRNSFEAQLMFTYTVLETVPAGMDEAPKSRGGARWAFRFSFRIAPALARVSVRMLERPSPGASADGLSR